MSELLDCPFCGSEAEWGKGKHGDGTDWDYIACSKCEAIGPSASVQREGNILDWNQRQPHPDSALLEFTFKHKIAYVKHPKDNWSIILNGESIYGGETPREALQQAMEQEK